MSGTKPEPLLEVDNLPRFVQNGQKDFFRGGQGNFVCRTGKQYGGTCR